MGYVYKRCKVQDNTATIEDEMSEERVYKTKIGAIPKIVNNFEPRTENHQNEARSTETGRRAGECVPSLQGDGVFAGYVLPLSAAGG